MKYKMRFTCEIHCGSGEFKELVGREIWESSKRNFHFTN